MDVITDGASPSDSEQASIRSLVVREIARIQLGTRAHLAKLLRAKGIKETPHCLSAARSGCDLARQELEDYLADGLASYVSSHLHGSEYFLCQRVSPDSAPWIANARSLVHYRRGPAGYDIWGRPELLKGEFAYPNTAFDVNEFLRGVSVQSGAKPCCFLIWVHGYNTDEKEGRDNLFKIRELYNKQGGCCQIVGFLWHGDPSSQSDFGQAIVAADISALALAGLVSHLRRSFPGAPISVAAHSLGCRVALQAAKRLPKGYINDLILFNAAVDYDVLEIGKDFGEVPEKVNKVWVIYHRQDDALIASTLLLAPFGPYYWSQHNVALGARGPKSPGNYAGEIEAIDVTQQWGQTQPPYETTHSALYVARVSRRFFADRFPLMVAGDIIFCR